MTLLFARSSALTPLPLPHTDVPPFRLAQQLADAAAADRESAEYQRLSWDALKKSLNGLVNKARKGGRL